jgi:hypothetical protein
MTPNSSTGYTPFFLLFGAEAVLPTDVHYCAPRIVTYVEEDAQTALADALDLLDEARDIALARSVVYQQSLRNYHSRRVRGRSFEPDNLVLRLKQTSTSKLESPWEGPYLIHEAILGGVMACKNSLLGIPRGTYDEHSSKSSLSCETKVYRTSRRKLNFRR